MEHNCDYRKDLRNALEWIVLLGCCLKELVDLKHIKQTDGETEDYLARKPVAWELANSTIDLYNKDNGFLYHPAPTFLNFTLVAQEWQDWSVKTYVNATALVSMKKLRHELKELIEEIESDTPSPLQDEGIPLMEFADCFMCLLHGAAKQGHSPDALLRAINNKMRINQKREWKENDDHTYSHIK